MKFKPIQKMNFFTDFVTALLQVVDPEGHYTELTDYWDFNSDQSRHPEICQPFAFY